MEPEQFKKLLEENNAKLEKNLNTNLDKKMKTQQKNLESMIDSKFQKILEPLKNKIENLEVKVTEVEKELNENVEISSKVRNLQLNSVPARDKEDLRAIYTVLASKLGYETPPEARIRRFKGNDDEKRPILLMFSTEFHKCEFLQRFRARSSEMMRSIFPNFPNDATRIYLQHDFTTTQYQLYKTAVKYVKDETISKVAVHTGNRIMIQFEPEGKFEFYPTSSALVAEVDRRKIPEAPEK